MKREIASLRADKENLEQFVNEVRVRISDLEKENASLQVKLGSSTKELEKKRDENRQWKDHIEILESERMKAQQEADACREKARITLLSSVLLSVLMCFSVFLYFIAARILERP